MDKILLPHRYLSYSQLDLWERDKEEYIRRYIYGEKSESNQYMDLGKELARALEKGYNGQNRAIQHLLIFLKQYPLKEYKIASEAIVGACTITIMGILDGFDENNEEIGEYKTGRLWTQRRADESDQLTFYSLIYFKKYKRLIKKIKLHWAETSLDENRQVYLTGRIEVFETKRTMADLMKMQARIEKAVKEISAMVEKEICLEQS